MAFMDNGCKEYAEELLRRIQVGLDIISESFDDPDVFMLATTYVEAGCEQLDMIHTMHTEDRPASELDVGLLRLNAILRAKGIDVPSDEDINSHVNSIVELERIATERLRSQGVN